MTYSTDSERRLDNRDDVRDEAYHAGEDARDENDAELDTEFDAAARPDATDTVDDETARDETARDEMVRDETARGEMGDDETARDEGFARDEMARDDVTGDGTAGYDDVVREEREEDETARQERAEDAEFDAAHEHQPTAVAVVPASTVDEAARDDFGAHEAGTDRDAVGAMETESGSVYGTGTGTETGSVYGTGTAGTEAAGAGMAGTEMAGAQHADNGPIVAQEDESATGAPAVHDEMMPGSVPSTPVAAFWSESDAQGMRERWRELQLRFIDDPESVAGEAEQLVEEAVASLTASLNRAKQDLGSWREGEGTDTEKLRAAVRTYRDFLNRVLGL